MFGVSSPLSAKTMRAPRSTKALTVETKVKLGAITSSPGPMSARMAAISRASVQEVVSSALGMP